MSDPQPAQRVPIAGLFVVASLLVGLAQNEGYTNRAIQPVPGDKWTNGFGNTVGVQRGDKTDPIRALIVLDNDLNNRKAEISSCVHVPLAQYELNAYLDLAYNIGIVSFCGSTLVKKLNDRDYRGACKQILVWDKFHGRVLNGLKKRRESEYKECLGEA